MDGRRPRDWDRFERVARVWSRKFERDMRAMGEQVERDFKDGCGFSCNAEAGDEARRAGGAHRRTGPICAWDWDRSPRARRAARRAARHATRAAAHVAAEGMARGMAGGASRAERRAARCSGGWWASYWWVVFPLFFVGKNAFEDAGGGTGFWAGLSGAVQNSIGSSLELTLAAPLAHLLERLIGVSFVEAFAMLALAGALSAAAGLIAWRMGRPQGQAQLL